MITAYAMAAGSNAAGLEEDVNRLIMAGYQPYGELKTEWVDKNLYAKQMYWYQPMVKEGLHELG
ncbi:hypothetical protein WS105_0649 [Weissella ceti]|nr:hypothetical protein WS105_0649 [Weissella ceti]